MSNIYVQEPPTEGKVLLETSAGEIEIELWSREAPKACRDGRTDGCRTGEPFLISNSSLLFCLGDFRKLMYLFMPYSKILLQFPPDSTPKCQYALLVERSNYALPDIGEAACNYLYFIHLYIPLRKNIEVEIGIIFRILFKMSMIKKLERVLYNNPINLFCLEHML